MAAKKAAGKRAVKSTIKSTDKRVVGTSKNPTKVTAPSAASYKMVPAIKVTKGKAGRPKRPQ